MVAVDAGNIPEEYYSYLENWYRSQVSAHITDNRTGSAPSLHTALSSPFSLQQVSSGPSTSTSVSSPVFIPVSALQNLRASLPAELPKISGGRSADCCPNIIVLRGLLLYRKPGWRGGRWWDCHLLNTWYL